MPEGKVPCDYAGDAANQACDNVSVSGNRTRFGCSRLIVFIMLAAFGCNENDKQSINIPEGYASQTLKDFAKQADVEIIFDAPSVVNIKTNSVNGHMSPEEALGTMLAGTSLVFRRDPSTGAYAVTVASISNRSAGWGVDALDRSKHAREIADVRRVDLPLRQENPRSYRETSMSVAENESNPERGVVDK